MFRITRTATRWLWHESIAQKGTATLSSSCNYPCAINLGWTWYNVDNSDRLGISDSFQLTWKRRMNDEYFFFYFVDSCQPWNAACNKLRHAYGLSVPSYRKSPYFSPLSFLRDLKIKCDKGEAKQIPLWSGATWIRKGEKGEVLCLGWGCELEEWWHRGWGISMYWGNMVA